MNIGILGLLPEQVRLVQQEFPHHSLRFLSKDRQGDTGQFAKGCDKVILMTKFIGHDMQDRVPERKRLFCNGSVAGLKSELQKLPTPARVVPSPPTLTKSSPTMATKQAPRASDAVDWSPLDNGNVGDVVRIKRPATVTIKAFDMRLSAGRSYRKSTRGVITSTHRMVDGYAVMTIKEKRSTEPEPVAAIATAPPDTSSAIAIQEEASMQISTDVQRPSTSMTLQPRESAFWQSVFVETMRQWPGAPIDTIASRADEALRAYAARASMASGDRH